MRKCWLHHLDLTPPTTLRCPQAGVDEGVAGVTAVVVDDVVVEADRAIVGIRWRLIELFCFSFSFSFSPLT